MNTATTTTLTLNEGFFARRNWFDWVFAALVAAGLLYALQRYGEYMDVYEKCILVGTIPAAIWLGWFWRSLRALLAEHDVCGVICQPDHRFGHLVAAGPTGHLLQQLSVTEHRQRDIGHFDGDLTLMCGLPLAARAATVTQRLGPGGQ